MEEMNRADMVTARTPQGQGRPPPECARPAHLPASPGDQSQPRGERLPAKGPFHHLNGAGDGRQLQPFRPVGGAYVNDRVRRHFIDGARPTTRSRLARTVPTGPARTGRNGNPGSRARSDGPADRVVDDRAGERPDKRLHLPARRRPSPSAGPSAPHAPRNPRR